MRKFLISCEVWEIEERQGLFEKEVVWQHPITRAGAASISKKEALKVLLEQVSRALLGESEGVKSDGTEFQEDVNPYDTLT